MDGIFGLVEKKGSGVFKGKGHWATQPLCVVMQIFFPLLNKQRGIRLVDSQ